MISLDILLVTFNQEQYILQALNGVLMQRVNSDVKLRIIVADDCSTDNTLSVIKETFWAGAKIASGNEVEVIYLPREKNLGISKNYQRAFANVSSDYVAILEGDDYWISYNHLQSHIDFLETHPECVMSSNRMYIKNELKGKFETYYPIIEDVMYSGDEQARTNRIGNLSTCVLRGKHLNNLSSQLFELEVDDWLLGLVLAQYGYLAKLHTPTSVYRMNLNSNWAAMSDSETKKRMLARIETYDKFLGGKYAVSFAELKNEILNEGKSKYWRYKRWIPPFLSKLIKWILPPICFE